MSTAKQYVPGGQVGTGVQNIMARVVNGQPTGKPVHMVQNGKPINRLARRAIKAMTRKK